MHRHYSTPVFPFIVNLKGAKSVQGGGQNPQKLRIEKPRFARLLHTSDILSAPQDLIPGYASGGGPGQPRISPLPWQPGCRGLQGFLLISQGILEKINWTARRFPSLMVGVFIKNQRFPVLWIRIRIIWPDPDQYYTIDLSNHWKSFTLGLLGI